jgi:hypothetical protein
LCISRVRLNKNPQLIIPILQPDKFEVHNN